MFVSSQFCRLSVLYLGDSKTAPRCLQDWVLIWRLILVLGWVQFLVVVCRTDIFISCCLSVGGHPQLPAATHIPCQVVPSILKPEIAGQILCALNLYFSLSLTCRPRLKRAHVIRSGNYGLCHTVLSNRRIYHKDYTWQLHMGESLEFHLSHQERNRLEDAAFSLWGRGRGEVHYIVHWCTCMTGLVAVNDQLGCQQNSQGSFLGSSWNPMGCLLLEPGKGSKLLPSAVSLQHLLLTGNMCQLKNVPVPALKSQSRWEKNEFGAERSKWKKKKIDNWHRVEGVKCENLKFTYIYVCI